MLHCRNQCVMLTVSAVQPDMSSIYNLKSSSVCTFLISYGISFHNLLREYEIALLKSCVLPLGINSEVTKLHPKGDDDIKFSID